MQKENETHHPLVSVVIPFYNTEKYLPECLDSIVRQTYGIENIEVILVDDCGQDDSSKVAQEYLPLLGEYVKVIKNSKNKGLGGARNTGIKHSSGKYLLFIDSDDFIEENTIEELIKTIKEHKSDIAIYNMHCFSELNKEYPLNPSFDIFKTFTSPSIKIHRYEFPKYPELAHSFSACNKLFKKEMFSKGRGFPENQHHEDALLIITLLCESKSISLVKNVYYQYRQREATKNKSITDTLFQTKSHFFEHIRIAEGLKALSHKYPELEYMLLWVSLRILGSPIIKLLTDDTPLSDKEDIEFYNELKSIFQKRDVRGTYAIGEKISESIISATNKLILSLTLNEARITYKKYYFNSPFKRKALKLVRNPKLFFVDMFRKQNNNPKSKIRSAIKKFENQANKEIILIGERPTDARDNSYWLFKYIREIYPKINIYYVIKEDSPDFDKVNKLGNIVIYDSLEHQKLFITCTVIICTHTRGTIEPSFFNKTTVKKQYPEYYQKHYIFIQHGINVGGFIKAFNKKNIINANFSKIICGAKPEYCYLKENLGYEQGEVSYTGLARFDSILQNKKKWGSKNKVLFMPTWRTDICSPSYEKNKTHNDYNFLSSNYYKRLLSFINNNKLQDLLKEYDAELHFIPHPEVDQYRHYITSSNQNIKIIDPDTIDIQKELIEAKLLITDYSSVFFDFVYMKKPVIFYQFDKEEFFSKHYKKGYYDFNKHHFGEVVTKEEELIRNIENNFQSSFTFSKKSEFTHRDFFEKYDKNNCKRIFEELSGFLNKEI